MMNNLLFISICPFPMDMGSKQHAYYYLKALCSFCNVYCIFFIAPNQEVPINMQSDIMSLGVKAYQVCYFKNLSVNNGYGRFLREVISFPCNFMNLATHKGGFQTINALVERYHIDIIHFEHFWFTKYALGIRSNLKKVIVYHDLHHTLYMQLAKIEKKYHKKLLNLITYLKFYIFEFLLARKVELNIFLNPVEMLSFQKNSIHIPHIANPNIFYRPARITNFFNIVFIGAFSHSPNRRSVEFIINRILPLLVNKRHNFKMHIIGTDTEKFQELLDSSEYRKYVVVHGFKADINQVFENMDIALFPIMDGGGIRTKIIDAMAAGVPVVTTSQGIYGLTMMPGNCIGIGSTPAELVSEILLLMSSYSLRQKRSKIGEGFIYREHSFEALLTKLPQYYGGIAAASCPTKADQMNLAGNGGH
jgi:glycosyltransferase involved in cell wall biosynthesis